MREIKRGSSNLVPFFSFLNSFHFFVFANLRKKRREKKERRGEHGRLGWGEGGWVKEEKRASQRALGAVSV